jgi:hypothetical protein
MCVHVCRYVTCMYDVCMYVRMYVRIYVRLGGQEDEWIRAFVRISTCFYMSVCNEQYITV